MKEEDLGHDLGEHCFKDTKAVWCLNGRAVAKRLSELLCATTIKLGKFCGFCVCFFRTGGSRKLTILRLATLPVQDSDWLANEERSSKWKTPPQKFKWGRNKR